MLHLLPEPNAGRPGDCRRRPDNRFSACQVPTPVSLLDTLEDGQDAAASGRGGELGGPLLAVWRQANFAGVTAELVDAGGRLPLVLPLRPREVDCFGLLCRVDHAGPPGHDVALGLDSPLAVRRVDDRDLPGVRLARLVPIDHQRYDLPGALVPLAVLLDRLVLAVPRSEKRSEPDE